MIVSLLVLALTGSTEGIYINGQKFFLDSTLERFRKILGAETSRYEGRTYEWEYKDGLSVHISFNSINAATDISMLWEGSGIPKKFKIFALVNDYRGKQHRVTLGLTKFSDVQSWAEKVDGIKPFMAGNFECGTMLLKGYRHHFAEGDGGFELAIRWSKAQPRTQKQLLSLPIRIIGLNSELPDESACSLNLTNFHSNNLSPKLSIK